MPPIEKKRFADSPKSSIPCPFLSRRDWRVKGNRCDFLRTKPFHNEHKHRIPCPFLRRKGFCFKGYRFDFSHDDFSHYNHGGFKGKNDQRCVPYFFFTLPSGKTAPTTSLVETFNRSPFPPSSSDNILQLYPYFHVTANSRVRRLLTNCFNCRDWRIDDSSSC